MKYVDLKKELNEYLTDEQRKISEDHLNEVCKIYQKHNTCRYIFLTPLGYICMKHSPMEKEINRLVKEGKMTSRSDNCRGIKK